MAAGELYIVGDLGASKLQLGVIGATGFLEFKSVDTPRGPDAILDEIATTASGYKTRYGEYLGDLAIGIGVPGPVRRTPKGTIAGPMSEISGLDREPISMAAQLAKANGNLRGAGVLVLNDADAATHQAPHIEGLRYPGNSRIVTYYTHSSGVGGGNILGGQIQSDLMESGKTPMLQPNGEYITLERLISGGAIKARYGGGERSAKDIGKDPLAGAVWDEVGQIFGRGIAVTIPTIGMGDVVIGGGVSRDHHRYEGALKKEIDAAMAAIPAGTIETPQISFVPADQIETMGLLGAYHALRSHRGVREYI